MRWNRVAVLTKEYIDHSLLYSSNPVFFNSSASSFRKKSSLLATISLSKNQREVLKFDIRSPGTNNTSSKDCCQQSKYNLKAVRLSNGGQNSSFGGIKPNSSFLGRFSWILMKECFHLISLKYQLGKKIKLTVNDPTQSSVLYSASLKFSSKKLLETMQCFSMCKL